MNWPRIRELVRKGKGRKLQRVIEEAVPILRGWANYFKLAEVKTNVHIARVFLDDCIVKLRDGKLDTVTASMAKYWVTDMQNKVMDECLQLFGGYGYTLEYPISKLYVDSRVQRIYGGANEIMKEIIARSI